MKRSKKEKKKKTTNPLQETPASLPWSKQCWVPSPVPWALSKCLDTKPYSWVQWWKFISTWPEHTTWTLKRFQLKVYR
jgi:hypothetical protein